jgi:hypothetical protein
VGELVKDVGVFDLICVVIHEDNNTLLRQDHFRESRPLVEAHRDVRRFIQVVGQIRLLKNIAVVSGLNEVAVDNEECHDIVGVIADPSGHFVEFFEISASIQKLARGVATEDRSVDIVRLALNHADTIIKLNSDTAILVGCKIAPDVKSSVVSDDLCDVAVFTVTELRVVIAGCSVGRLSTAAGTSTCGGGCASRIRMRTQSDSPVDDALGHNASSANKQSSNACRAFGYRSGRSSSSAR